MEEEKRLRNIDYLRGIAVLGVCFVHFIVPTPIFREFVILRQVFAYGKYGVELFFLISGFIIPYSMYQKGYQVNDFFRFLSRRLVRIEIPFVVNIIFVIILGYLATLHPLYKGMPFKVDTFNLIAHFGYLNIFFGNTWINPVYWTLAIEFHYYLTVAIIFPFLFRNRRYRFVIFAVLLIPQFLTDYFSIFRFYGYFILGITSFLLYIESIKKKEALIIIIVVTIYIIYFRGWFNLIVISTFLYFVFSGRNFNSRFLGYIGRISFSLYLYHFIGGKIQNLGFNYINGEYDRLILIPLAFIVSIFLSHIMYYTIERYSLDVARRIRYKTSPMLYKPHIILPKE